MSRAAMQQALEALANARDFIGEEQYKNPTKEWNSWQQADELQQALLVIRAALAEPEQEPVGWQWLNTCNYRKKLPANAIPEHWRPLYTAPTPRQWVSLTEQEMYDLFFNDQYGPRLPEYLVNTIKCVEAALKEKNNG